jgi:hypothetical protein
MFKKIRKHRGRFDVDEEKTPIWHEQRSAGDSRLRSPAFSSEHGGA